MTPNNKPSIFLFISQ